MINSITYNQYKDTLKNLIISKCTNVSNYAFIKNNKWFNGSEIVIRSYGYNKNVGTIKVKCTTSYSQFSVNDVTNTLSWIDTFCKNKGTSNIYSSDLINLIDDTQRYLLNNIAFIVSSFTTDTFTYFYNKTYTPSYRANFLGYELVSAYNIISTLSSNKWFYTYSADYYANYDRGSKGWVKLT